MNTLSWIDQLGCPLDPSRPPLRQEGDWLICDSCKMKFPIRDGIPHLVSDEAVPVEDSGANPPQE
ncbi:MAG: Trm112 family protein [Armatimonadetes bacterium]|nr:Trm112 family protein [Armatimonadota bacterium]